MRLFKLDFANSSKLQIARTIKVCNSELGLRISVARWWRNNQLLLSRTASKDEIWKINNCLTKDKNNYLCAGIPERLLCSRASKFWFPSLQLAGVARWKVGCIACHQMRKSFRYGHFARKRQTLVWAFAAPRWVSLAQPSGAFWARLADDLRFFDLTSAGPIGLTRHERKTSWIF